MPEVRFRVRWADGSSRDCYSPSTVIHDYLTVGAALTVDAFLLQIRAGLQAASRRVEARYGSPCTIALREISEIERIAALQAPDGTVSIESIDRGDRR